MSSNNDEYNLMVNLGFYDGETSEKAHPPDSSKYWDGFHLAYSEVKNISLLEGKIMFLKKIILIREKNAKEFYMPLLDEFHSRSCQLQQLASEILMDSIDSELCRSTLVNSDFKIRVAELEKDITEFSMTINII